MFTGALQEIRRQIFIALLAVVFLIPLSSSAEVYTNENFLFSYHYKPTTFSILSSGGFSGTLENGSTFTQTSILSQQSVRLQKFTIDDAYFYVSDQGTFQASSNLVALSIYSYLATA